MFCDITWAFCPKNSGTYCASVAESPRSLLSQFYHWAHTWLYRKAVVLQVIVRSFDRSVSYTNPKFVAGTSNGGTHCNTFICGKNVLISHFLQPDKHSFLPFCGIPKQLGRPYFSFMVIACKILVLSQGNSLFCLKIAYKIMKKAFDFILPQLSTGYQLPFSAMQRMGTGIFLLLFWFLSFFCFSRSILLYSCYFISFIHSFNQNTLRTQRGHWVRRAKCWWL